MSVTTGTNDIRGDFSIGQCGIQKKNMFVLRRSVKACSTLSPRFSGSWSGRVQPLLKGHGTFGIHAASTLMLLGLSASMISPKVQCDNGMDQKEDVPPSPITPKSDLETGSTNELTSNGEESKKSGGWRAACLELADIFTALGTMPTTFVVGAATGYMAKKIATLFVGHLMLEVDDELKENPSFITKKLRKLEIWCLDLDHNGEVTPNDARLLLNEAIQVVSSELKPSSRFGTGFFLGLRKG